MSTLIPHVVYRIDYDKEFSINGVKDKYENILQNFKNGVILDSRDCNDISKLKLFIEAWAKVARIDFEIICLMNYEQFNIIYQIVSDRIEIAVLISNSIQLFDKNLIKQRPKLNLILQTKTKKELIEMFDNPQCNSILKNGKYSVLPNSDAVAMARFSAKEYYDVVKKHFVKRDHRFPLLLDKQFEFHFKICILHELVQPQQNPEISFIVPYNTAASEIKSTIKSLKDSAAFAKLPIEIITVENKVQNFFTAGHARNAGAQKAKAQTICFVDSDITVGKEFVKHVTEALQNQKVVQFKRYYGLEERIIEPSYWKPFYNCESWPDMENFWRFTCTYALAMPKELFYKAGQFQEHFLSYGFEDVDLGYRVSKITKQFYLSDQRVFHPDITTNEIEYLYRLRRFGQLSTSASLFFLDHLDFEVGHLVRNFFRWEHFKARVSLCSVFFRDKNRGNLP